MAIPRDSAKLFKSVHPYGSNGGAFAQDQPDLQSIAPSWRLAQKGDEKDRGGTVRTIRGRLPDPRYLLFSFLMLFRFLSTAFVVAGAFAPLSAEAKSSCGLASHYGIGDGYHGQTAADGSRFDAHGLTVASPSLPLGTRLRVVNPANGKTVVVKVTDRGPWHNNRILDLSYAAFLRVANPSQGVARLCFARA